MKPLPFYEVYKELIWPTTLAFTSSQQFEEVHFTFALTPQQVQQILSLRGSTRNQMQLYRTGAAKVFVSVKSAAPGGLFPSHPLCQGQWKTVAPAGYLHHPAARCQEMV